ncbi:hypothetical protein PAESOLCIP111_04850 [Paenibacillus solanacearum]|uniref:Uncharacterized protein n=1 Tax=Paenibacillus solanacearum TaxID=2048548 RepID=A0A916K6E4_9BACL|nr:S-layer homology domain-containing protein [Paenibacillus solanacearum]CAG7644984.1 hypothetical protein PAESOLCIP111_04850 [Paenibacillus solanacearum]
MGNSRSTRTERLARQFLCILMVLCMIASFAPASQARPANIIEAGSVTGVVGDTVDVPVYVTPADGVWKYDITVAYDPDVLEYAGISDEASSASFAPVTTLAGQIQVKASEFGLLSYIIEKQKIFTVRLKVKSLNGSSAAVPVNLSGTVTEDTAPVTAAAIPGQVTIQHAAVVQIGSVSGQAGTTVEVPVTVVNATYGIASYGMQVDFDKQALEVVSIQEAAGGGLFSSNFNNTQGWLRTAWADIETGNRALGSGQRLFTVTFKIKNSAASGDTALTVNGQDIRHVTFTDSSGAEMKKTITEGKVTVSSATFTIAAIANQTAAPLLQGYAAGTQETQTIQVTNTGTGQLTHLAVVLGGAHADAFEATQPIATTLNSGASPTTFTVKAKDGLTAGTYTATITISADDMNDVTLTVTQVVHLPNAPANPLNLAAAAGDRYVQLTWDTVTGATYYNLYMSTVSGKFDSAAAATVTDAAYRVQQLMNGTTYYFVVKAGNTGGLSAASNEAGATPATVPSAPASVTATAGSNQATVSFTAPTRDGGSAITGYEVTSSPDGVVQRGTSSPIIVTGLTGGTSYTFTVKAVNRIGSSMASPASNAVTPVAQDNEEPSQPSGTTGGTPSQPAVEEPEKAGVDIWVNGKAERAGTATTTTVNDRTVTAVAVDPSKLDAKLAAEGEHAVVTIQVNGGSDTIIGELNGQMVQNMEAKQAILELKTDHAIYTLPAQQINMGSISEQIGKSVALQDIKIYIEVAKPAADTVKIVENSASSGQFTIVAPPIDFKVTATYGDQIVDISKFNTYVERAIAIPEGADPSKITTGVVIDPDGTVRHVPTQIQVIDGKYYALINSLTNSTYSVVWHPVTFSDAANHWAQGAIHDMGSRMVIQGTGAGMFSPDQDITRAEFAAILVRGLGLKPERATTPFTDVSESDWYSSAVNTAFAYRLITGFEDGSFRPNDKITREQAMVILSQAIAITELKQKLSSKPGAALESFMDADAVSSWAASGIADCLELGIVSGRSSVELAPQAFMTRAEVAHIIQRLLQQSGLI